MHMRSALMVGCLVGAVAGLGGCGGDSFQQPPPAPSDDASADAAPSPDAAGEAETGKPDAADVGSDQAADSPAEAPSEAGALGNGEPCQSNEQCASLVCANGTCCNESCDGCNACDVDGHAGTCWPIPSGENPGDVCGQSGELCAGSCDGAGACVFPDSATTCGPSSCSGPASSTQARCDGAGHCSDVASDCSPYACTQASGDCATSCVSGQTGCAPGAWCTPESVCAGKAANGQPCAADEGCVSDHCADGVCCESACDGVCEVCNATGFEGECVPSGEGTDPDGECLGIDPACGGSCDGAGACAWPGSAKQCGASVCAAGTAVQHQFRCDGAGSCTEVFAQCEPFVCDPSTSSCKTACGSDQDCVSGDYCQSPACLLKKDNGQLCGGPNQCQSGFCELSQFGATCCIQSCPLPNDCSTGQCFCGDVPCGLGASCVLWYPDVDQDGFGDGAQPRAACDNQPPTDSNGHPYVLDHADCYDANSLARPGQTAYFFADRGDGSFDYDCSGAYEKEYRDGLTSYLLCADCKRPQTCETCGTNGSYFNFGFLCNPAPACGAVYSKGFQGTRPCGTKGTLFSCKNLALQCTTGVEQTADVEQRCH